MSRKVHTRLLFALYASRKSLKCQEASASLVELIQGYTRIVQGLHVARSLLPYSHVAQETTRAQCTNVTRHVPMKSARKAIMGLIITLSRI
jgi:hypothetical protein